MQSSPAPFRRRLGALTLAVFLAAVARDSAAAPDPKSFTIAVIPDTQNYVDYSHQKVEGFPFDAKDLFIEQMRYVAEHLRSRGGDIAFVTGMGDVWQHQSLPIDPEHAARGFKWVANPLIDKALPIGPKVRDVEMPSARQGYALIAGATPFSVVPGNHDYDAMWTDANHPPAAEFKTIADAGLLHAGGLTNFVSVFGDQTDFFRGQKWYVASHDHGADSAQIFSAGGYRFLHIGLQFDPPNASLAWAAEVIKRFPGLPTIVSTHDYLDTDGRRGPNPIIENNAIDPEDNTSQMVWDKLISAHDQIFLVLCGHEHGQAFRTDDNRAGHKVYQILADYQDRAQTLVDAGMTPTPFLAIGDGWFRLMTFTMGGATPKVHVHTYSTHYKKASVDLPDYARWYRPHEQPKMSDQAFMASDDFVIDLTDFRARFGAPR